MDAALKPAEPLTLACALAVEERRRPQRRRDAPPGSASGAACPLPEGRLVSLRPRRRARLGTRARHARHGHAASSTRTAPSSGRASRFAVPGARHRSRLRRRRRASTTRRSAASSRGGPARSPSTSRARRSPRPAGWPAWSGRSPTLPSSPSGSSRSAATPDGAHRLGRRRRGHSRPSRARASERVPRGARRRSPALERAAAAACRRSATGDQARSRRQPAKLLRRRRPGDRHRREAARTPRPARLRAPRDRPQRARRAGSRGAWRDLRRDRAGRPRGRARRPLGARCRAAGLRKCAERGLQVVDAVCPLVSKVHAEARRYAARGHKIALVGHAGHDEVEGTMGEAPDSIVLVETPEDVEALELDGRAAASRT